MSWNFVSLAVETANSNPSSICRIGIARFQDGVIVEEADMLVNPDAEFEAENIEVHGINANDVAGQPNLEEALSLLLGQSEVGVIMHHDPLNRAVFNHAFKKLAWAPVWLNSMFVIRQSWNKIARNGVELNKFAQHFNFPLNEKEALSRAKVCGLIACRAFNKSGNGPEEWVTRFENQRKSRLSEVAVVDENTAPIELKVAGKFAGKTILLTGKFERPRLELENEAQSVGFEVARTVTKNVDLLVVGSIKVDATEGDAKTGQHKRIEKLIADGADINIIFEDKFDALIEFGRN